MKEREMYIMEMRKKDPLYFRNFVNERGYDETIKLLMNIGENMNYAFLLNDVKILLNIYEGIKGKKDKKSLEIKKYIKGFLGDYFINYRRNVIEKDKGVLSKYKKSFYKRSRALLKGKHNKYLRREINDIAFLSWRERI